MTIYEKLSAVQTELKAPKGQYNRFGKYNYRSCEDILEVAKPLCVANKAIVMLSDTVELIGDRYYIKASAHFRDIETNEEVIAEAYAREEDVKKGMDGCQITGTASSYARKYALNGLFCIDDTKDSDTDEMKVELEQRAAQSQTTTKKTQKQTAKQPQPYEVESPTAQDVQNMARDVAENLDMPDRGRAIRAFKRLDEKTQRNWLKYLNLNNIDDLSDQRQIEMLINSYIKNNIKW